MDGLNYVDHKTPIMVTSGSTISLLTTYQALVTPGNLPIMGSNYFNWVGKAVRVRAFGQATSAATPGNFQLGIMYGDGTNNNGTSLGNLSGTWTANNVGLSWIAEWIVRCRATGTSGSLFGVASFLFQGWGIGTITPFNAAPVTVDLTQPYYFSPQWLRSGSTAETCQLHEIMYEALN